MALACVLWLLKGKANLKQEIARRVELDAATLPYSKGLLSYLREQYAIGRPLILVTASHRKFADQIAAHLGFFVEVHSTENNINLVGNHKRDYLCNRLGVKDFDYAGNSRADLAVWRQSRNAILVNPKRGVRTAAHKIASITGIIEDGHSGFKHHIQAMRIYQWFKNLLVFVPLAAAHKLGEFALLGQVVLAFVAFGLCASSAYILNDLLDLSADRGHARKRLRPYASGNASVKVGVALVPMLFVMGMAIAMILPPLFAGMLTLYYVSTIAYSLWLKSKVLVDVLVLTGLYTARILCGAAAATIIPSFCLLAFSMFLFLSLAMVKRFAELYELRNNSGTVAKGRGYQVADIAIVQSLGTAAGYCAVLVLTLYINSDDVHTSYTNPEAIWLLCPLLLYWVSRMWQCAGRGQMHDDPIVFALEDNISRWIVLVGSVVVLLAT
jgi:4-hydroxybenzoate polyprenyltransferase